MQINIKHILIGWYNKIFLKEQDLANYRLDICKHCQHNVKFLGQDSCDLCGCILDATPNGIACIKKHPSAIKNPYWIFFFVSSFFIYITSISFIEFGIIYKK